ncbi:MAG: hypothetical protein VX463_03955, partial [Pseudomonadota bacterium]|nr:hypothetical protein [Pseudomonadota bacterium]
MRRAAGGLAPLAVASGLAVLSGPPAASACGFDGAPPAPTLADRLFDADALALAVPDPGAPGGWRLEAAPEAVSVSLDPPDPARFLAAGADGGAGPAPGPGGAGLFGHDPVDDAGRRLAVLDAGGRAAASRLLAAARDWDGPEDPARFVLAAEMAGEADPAARALGLAELGRAPCEALADLPATLSAPELVALLSGTGGAVAPAESAPSLALLLGLTGTPEARAEIGRRLDLAAAGRADASPDPMTGAWVAALIALDGPAGAEAAAARFLADDAEVRPAPSLAPVVEALAEAAATGDAATRAAVLDVMTAALGRRPDLVGPVARSFGARWDWAMQGPAQAA